MATFDFKDYIPLYSELLNEVYELSLHYFRLGLGFYLGFSFVNFGSFLDWLLVITIMDFIFTKVISEILHDLLPHSMHGFLSKNIIPEFIALGIISLILQQSLLLLVASRLLYFAFCFFSLLFSRLFLESIAISYYLKSAWYLLPVAINVLISMMYLMDRYFDMNLFNYFLELPIVQGVFAELGIQTDMFLNYQIKMNPQESQYYHLVLKDNELLNDFRRHFLSSSSRVSLKEKLNEFKIKLSEFYQLNPALYRNQSGENMVLPMKWNELKELLKTYPKEVHEEILKQYYRNTYHTVWRSLQLDNPWLSKDIDSIKHHDSFQESHYQELLLYMWLRAQKANQESDFIEQMAKLYRKRNFSLNGQRMFEDKMDNFKADMPDSIEHFQNYVLHQLERCTHTNLVTETKIKQLWNQSITNYWKNMLKQMSIHEFFELRFLWKKVLSGAEDIKKTSFQDMDLDFEFKKNFIKEMKQKYDKKWQAHHTQYVEKLFYLNHSYSCHVEKFCLVFSNLMKKYFKEDIAIKIKEYEQASQTTGLSA